MTIPVTGSTAGQGAEVRALTRSPDKQLIDAVFFLASPDADFISGQTVNVEGGKHML